MECGHSDGDPVADDVRRPCGTFEVALRWPDAEAGGVRQAIVFDDAVVVVGMLQRYSGRSSVRADVDPLRPLRQID